MTDILSREQEFLKINEHLNKMTKYAIEKPQPAKIDSKFATYTKKGPSLVCRHGGNTKPDEVLLNGLKEKNNNIPPKDIVCHTGARKKMLPKERPLQGIIEEKKHHGELHTVLTSPRSSVKTYPASRNSVAKNASNIVIRYKNSAFIQSPSLEVLVKEENESIRSQATFHGSDISGGQLTARSKLSKVQLSSEGIVKFLKSRIAIMQEEHSSLTHEMSNQKELVEKSVERQKKIESQRDMAYTRNNTLTDQMAKLEAQYEEALRRIKETEGEHSDTRKELETAKREVKVLTQANTNLEKRLYRTNEELENSRNSLNQMRNAEKEVKESIRNESEAHDKQLKCLKKQRADLLNAYKKQLFLIDNLKRQNACMEQSRMIAFGEKEFTKVLDWQSKN